MTLLGVIRHGPTEWNRDKKLQGMSDIPLSAPGRLAVESWRVPKEFQRWRWIASPLVRAQETARLIGGGAAISPEPLLREMSFGQWEGRTLPSCCPKAAPISRPWPIAASTCCRPAANRPAW